jgi:addiction module RelE/StbE family toxin
MRIVWSPEAREDLLSLFSYVAGDDLKAAKKLRKVILSKIELLAKAPHIGRSGRVPGTKELIIENTPYIIPYRYKDDRLEIVRVYHSSRKWPEKFG